MVSPSRSLHARIPEDVYAAVSQSGQQAQPLVSGIVVKYISDPEAIARDTFYHFKESGEKRPLHDVSLSLSVAERDQFFAVAEALHVTQRDLICNAIIKRFNLDMSKIPYANAAPSLEHDPEVLSKLSLGKATPAEQAALDDARQQPQPPLVQPATFGDMNRVIAEAGDRSAHVRAGLNAEREQRRRINYVIPEWKK
jgi:hypothetical protein